MRPVILLRHQESPLRHAGQPDDALTLLFSQFLPLFFWLFLKLWTVTHDSCPKAQALGQRNSGWVYARSVKRFKDSTIFFI